MIRVMRDAVLRWIFRWPEHRGKYRIAQWIGRYLLAGDGVLILSPGGLKFVLHPRDWIEYTLLCGRTYEPLTIDFLRSNLREGNKAGLAGVNFGQHVAEAARVVGKSGHIYGFEPQPSALIKSNKHLHLNGLATRVTLVSAALGDREGILPMAWSDPSNAGAASLLNSGEGIIVTLARLDHILPKLCADRFRLFLLDVQGFELSVLRGLSQESAPELLIVEADPEFMDRSGTTPQNLIDRLVELGYETFDICGSPIDANYGEIPERNIVGRRPGTNVVWSRTDADT